MLDHALSVPQFSKFANWMRERGYTVHNEPGYRGMLVFIKRYTRTGKRHTGGTAQFDQGGFDGHAYRHVVKYTLTSMKEMRIGDESDEPFYRLMSAFLEKIEQTDEYYNTNVKKFHVKGYGITDVRRKQYHVLPPERYDDASEYHQNNITHLENVAEQYIRSQSIKRRTNMPDL